jgi:hypothetical protein
LFFGRAAERFKQELALLGGDLAETTTRFLFFSGQLLRELKYFGAADVGLAVTGIRNAIAFASLRGHAGYYTAFDQSVYRETLRTMSVSLDSNPRDLARRLLRRLFHASGAVGTFDPSK